MLHSAVLGIDIGSVSVSCALVEPGKDIRDTQTAYVFHRGRIRDTLLLTIRGMDLPSSVAVAVTSGSPPLLRAGRTVDRQVSLISGCARVFPSVGSILFVGGERFGLIRLDEDGAYRGTRSNSSCAAGTGSFLDQQARRLGLNGVEELADCALANTREVPKISTRCAVFARTDLVHAQQAGCSLEEICDGLCRGLAQNIVDTLLGGEQPREPVVFAGGVALNEAVCRHLEGILRVRVVSHGFSPVLGALGAALTVAESDAPCEAVDLRGEGVDALLGSPDSARQYFFAPLDLDSQTAADASASGGSAAEFRYQFDSGPRSRAHAVEVDVYQADAGAAVDKAQPREVPVRMGIDVGSTSTKAIIIDGARAPIAGFYTRTLGSPLSATQALCEAIEDFAIRAGVRFRFLGVGATGAGRKFIGAIVRADLVVDEITAHARAAYELDAGIDTIIEIGGQDAKFTTMRDGMVTFSHMNTVCAAGTGSFLEEQAARLGCDLASYEERVRGVRAPLASDRCAVFMERDINTFLAQGYSPDEILAAALYSVRENYLSKVARGASIGSRVCFQGATARNRALVAAFAQGLGKPVFVSRYCHLTGALGAALLVEERALERRGAQASSFRGLAGLREQIPVRAETCGLCSNHCRISVAIVAGETVAYGFLCGRDYATEHFVSRNRSGFDLLAERRRVFGAERSPKRVPGGAPVIGIPAALSLFETLPLWKRFFSSLSIPFVTSEGMTDSVARGREVAGAEFCAPIASLHGHVTHLIEEADFVFLPFFRGESDPDSKAHRMYCHYTQYASSLASGIGEGRLRERCLMPLVSYSKWKDRAQRELYETLAAAGVPRLTPAAVTRAFDRAIAFHDAGIRRLERRFREEMGLDGEPRVVLIGRPYTALSPEMSKGIPEIFGSLGVKTFFQDMIPYDRAEVAEVAPLLEAVHWKHAAKDLEVACVAANTPNLYPVFVTSFKCSPDSFAIEYFKRILDSRGKPYLILQLDDHDSAVGYETRIEAGVASFRNHSRRGRPGEMPCATMPSPSGERERYRSTRDCPQLPINPRLAKSLEGKTLLLPIWDPLLNPLMAACLRREGIDARALREDPAIIRKAMRHNTGQCIPLNIIAEDFVDYVRQHDLDPGSTALWIPQMGLSCNITMFPHFTKSLLESFGGGMEKTDVYSGEISFSEISLRAALNAFRAALVGGLLLRVSCRLRPYERVPGATDRALAGAMEVLETAFEGKASKDAALRTVVGLFDAIETSREPRPKVAIFGDMYVRDNDVLNQGLVHAIERAGGEVIATPLIEYYRIMIGSYFRRWLEMRDYSTWLTVKMIWTVGDAVASRYRTYFEKFLEEDSPVDPGAARWLLESFGVRPEHAGESSDNLQKIFHLLRAHPDIRLFVQASPAFCCPSLITEAMSRTVERLTGVPVVNVTYDGTGEYRNDVFEPWLREPLRASSVQSPSA
jgi:predicted CoA-substrate-specific enzyme activase